MCVCVRGGVLRIEHTRSNEIRLFTMGCWFGEMVIGRLGDKEKIISILKL